jgi:N-glycosylase/DNA lyase
MVQTKIIMKSFLKTGITNTLSGSEDMWWVEDEMWMQNRTVNQCKRAVLKTIYKVTVMKILCIMLGNR